MKNLITKVRNEIIKNENLTHLDVITYILAKQRVSLRGDCLIDINYIYTMLDVNKPVFYGSIRESLSTLCERGYINLKDVKYNSITAQEFSKVKPKDDFIIEFNEIDATETVVIDDMELNKVIQVSKNFKSRMQFIRYYLLVKYLPQTSIKILTDNEKVVTNYHNALLEYKLIPTQEN